MATDTRPDAELVTAWVAGDQSAFAAVYDRYADALFAFAQSRLRDRAAAADAVQETFLRAARRVDQLRDRTRLRAWLYAIARNQVVDAVRGPDLLATTELDDMTSDDRDPADVAAAGEAAALLRDAALGLNERDQELLDLHLRHGLDGADLADVAGLSRPQTYVAMNRLRARLAKAVGVVLVARHGSKDCAALSELLRGWDGRFTLEVRSRVTRHVEGCAECGRRRSQLVAAVQLSPAALGIPLLAAPALLRTTTIARVAEVRPVVTAAPTGPGHGAAGGDPSASTPPGVAAGRAPARQGEMRSVGALGRSEGWRRDGFPVATDRHGRRRAIVLVGAAAVLVVALVGVALSRRDGAAETDAVRAVAAPSTGVATVVATTLAPTTVATSAPPTSTSTTTTAAPATSLADPTSTVATSVPDSVPALPGGIEPSLAAPASTTGPVTEPGIEAEPPPPADVADADPTVPPEPPPVTATTVVVPPPPPPGHIVVLSGPVTLGPTTASGTVRIRNDGGQAAGWSAATGNGAFSVSPAGGSLEPGQEADITVGVDRAGLPEGAHSTPVSIAGDDGGGAVTVSATVERAPVITALGRTPPVVRTSGSCGPTLVTVSVTATDESPIGSVQVQWSSDGMFAQLTTLSPSGGGAYLGQVGGFTSAGSHSLKAIVTDVRGNTASQSTTVTVVPC